MSSSNGFFAHQSNANAGKTLKRRIDNRGIGDIHEERIRYAPPQKRARSQTHGRIPLYHHDGSNVSRVSNYGHVIGFNSSNRFPFALRNNDSSSQSFGYLGNPNNPQLVPLPLPYRKLDDDRSFDSLPEWVPNRSNFPIRSSNFVPNTDRDITVVGFNPQAPVLTNFPNPMPKNHSNMISTVSQAMPQLPIVGKDLSDLLTILKSENEKQNSSKSDESPLGLDFDPAKLKVRHESVIKALYSDMPRQCSSCGVRFKCQEDHSNHMDWHVRKNRMAKDANKTTTRLNQKPNKSRDWFASSSLWLTAANGGRIEAAKASFNANGETQKEKEEEQQRVVPADENQKMCALCEEPFEEFFSHEDDDWMYKDAVYLNMNKLGPIVHAKCMPETRKGPAKDSREPMVMSVTVPSVASALVC